MCESEAVKGGGALPEGLGSTGAVSRGEDAVERARMWRRQERHMVMEGAVDWVSNVHSLPGLRGTYWTAKLLAGLHFSRESFQRLIPKIQ